MKNNDLKIKNLANIIINHSISVLPGEKVLIRYKHGSSIPLIKELILEIFNKGGIPFVKLEDIELNTLLTHNYSKESVMEVIKRREFDVVNHDAFISIGYNQKNNFSVFENFEFNKLYSLQVKNINSLYNQKKWVLLNYPSKMDAELSQMSFKSFYDYAFNAMTVDYTKMKEELIPLRELMKNTKTVKIIAPDTNLTFSIEDIGAKILAGNINIPDGEVFSAPVLDSVNGFIKFNVDSPYKGITFHDIKLNFINGKVVNCVAGNDSMSKQMNNILDMDSGSRYVGEFAFGVNKQITSPCNDILYDEKIYGSFHIALGNPYSEANNGNSSAIHWDMIKILRPEYGGGEIYFDDILIQKDGEFVVDNLVHLNKQRIR